MIESSQHRARRPFGASLGLILATLVVFLVPGWNEALQLDRGGIAAGKWWLLLTGHFTHWNLDHLTWDLLTFAILSAFCESRSRRRFLICLGLSGFVISAGFLFYEVEFTAYRGLSGLDSALFGLAMVELIRAARTERRKALQGIAMAGMVGFLGKTLVELTTGGTVFVANADGAFLPVPSAHLLGFLCGIAIGWTWQHGGTRARDTVSGLPGGLSALRRRRDLLSKGS